MDYSDDEDRIYFTVANVWEYLGEIEADNLFKINLLKKPASFSQEKNKILFKPVSTYDVRQSE